MSCRYLIDYLLEVGPTESGGLGPAPLSHQELLAWQMNMRRFLQPWEISMLRRLSMEWVAQSYAAEEPNCPAPWHPAEQSAAESLAVAQNLRARMRAKAGL